MPTKLVLQQLGPLTRGKEVKMEMCPKFEIGQKGCLPAKQQSP